MYRTPPKDREAKSVAAGRITELFAPKRRAVHGKLVPEVDCNVKGSAVGLRRMNSAPLGATGKSNPPRTIDDGRSVKSVVSSKSTRSQIDFLEKQRLTAKKSFEFRQIQQEKLDSIEMEMLELKRRQALREKTEMEVFQKTDTELSRKIDQLVLEDDLEAD